MTRRVVSFLFAAPAITLPQVRCYNCDAIAPPVLSNPQDRGDPKLPDGRSQKEAILKEDHEASLKEADELVKLAEALKADLVKNDRHVLSVSSVKNLDRMEKIVKSIRRRMKRL
jgi:hypothetical protein